jgi:hypothetical protein
MAIEWMVGLECEPKKLLGLDRLVAKAKGRRQAEALLESLREKGDTRDISQISITSVRQGPDGAQVQMQVPLSALFANADDLEAHASTCKACPANMLGRTAGCYGAINYPIARETEVWLLSLLPNDPHATAATLLMGALHDFQYDGAPVARLRNGTGTFFTSDATEVLTWEDGTRIDSNQLLQTIFFVGAVQPSHALMLLLFLGALPHAIEPDELRALMNDARARAAALTPTKIPTGPQSAQVDAMRMFFAAMARAVVLSVPLAVDA